MLRCNGKNMQEVHCSFYKKINELDDGTYSIARYHAISEVPKLALWKQDIFTVLGRDLPRQKNREIIFYGEWKENIYKKRKSLQFHAERFKVLLPETKEAIQEVLADEVPGIGKKTAKAIVDAFGTDTFHVLKEPPKHETIPRIKLMAVTATNLASPLFFSSKRIIMPTTYAIYTIFVAMELIN